MRGLAAYHYINNKPQEMQKHFLSIVLLCSLFSITIYSQGPASKSEAKINQVQSQFGLSGEGVLTIMMDRGIDYRHPDFIDANGETRIAYIYDLYDMTGADDADNPFGIGTIYDSNEINTALTNGAAPLTNDIFGHGTATTGIMSGNGSAVIPNDKFRGVAYNAKIISIVVTKDFVPPFGTNPGQAGAYDPNLLKIAFDFAELKIDELEMPSVTLLNIGSIQDPTDGSTKFCEIVDDYVANGHTFVCGVGDDGGKDNHLISNLVENNTKDIRIEKGEAGNLRFAGWYNENDRFDLEIIRPNGQTEGPFSPPSSATDTQDYFLDQLNIFHRGKDVEFAESDSDLRLLLIDMFGDNGEYTIRITPTNINSDGTMHVFLNPALFYNNNAFLDNDNPGGNINSFSACPASISPGDYVATNNWTDIDGVARSKTGEGLPGELWVGSSIGPTMDGRLGIDLVAPGEIAWSAYGEDSYYSSFAFNTLEDSDGFYGIQTAVSAAAPITAGVIALMLEINPNLSPSEIKNILQTSAREDNFTGTTPNARWGHGKLDALEAINQTYLTVSSDDISILNTQVDLLPNPTDEFLEIRYPESLAEVMPISIYTVDGRKLMTKEYRRYENLDISAINEGIYILKMHSKNGIIAKLLYKE